ncbi:hypothetical protein GAP32_357 [Cronobacter phage vB_CsaM_GAP32]|uniref:Uncharacterized protein n=1 Tax=Cronobacter phage vB_CsaM_GAP32 TaxID=1141136 RepID=K4F7M7_9CAUD|nr:hypothetical protein GAP32_357 [Cronobacter phage vB_CsaM_GAP32]AFC21807.1 hypothetical protein GAP32_357 [Cronobacter phage vB_CsaM_GAP32]
MKYFRVNCGDASGMSEFWEYFALPDNYDIEDAVDMYTENNQWVYSLDCDRRRSEELTEEQYKTGILFNKMYEYKYELNEIRREYNIYPTMDMAVKFAKRDHKSGYVRVGQPHIHNVYKVNADGNFIFVYHHWSDRVGVLK